MKKFPITAIILTKNEASMIEHCMACLEWCKEILVVDTGSSDQTVAIAQASGARVMQEFSQSFAIVRTKALAAAREPWVLYIDADERVTPSLAVALQQVVAADTADAVKMHRKNIFFAREFTHGGWQKDFVTRLFRRTALESWKGDIHESPVWKGTLIQVKEDLVHFSHRSVADGLIKSAAWTPMEAAAFVKAGHPPVTSLLVFRKFFGELFRRLIRDRGYKDGAAGVFESLIQACNRAFVYIQIWEQQQQPSLADRYKKFEDSISSEWQKAS